MWRPLATGDSPQLSRPLIAADQSVDRTVDAFVPGQDNSYPHGSVMSDGAQGGGRAEGRAGVAPDSPAAPHAGPDEVVVEANNHEQLAARSSGAKAKAKSGPSRSSRAAARSSPNGGITQKTQIRVTRRTGTLRGWKLRYQDFLPDKKSLESAPEPFQSLVDRANDWLRKNSDVTVKTCETMTWFDPDSAAIGNSEQMVLTTRVAEGSMDCNLRGLRLWLVPGPVGTKPSRIACTDVTPTSSDTIQSLVAKVNKKLENNTLKGRIITMETISAPVVGDQSIDSQVTWWQNSYDADIGFAFCVRVFHDVDAPNTDCVVGVRDFVPALSEDGYEGFAQLSDRANWWLKDQPDVAIINMQSIMVRKEDDGPHTDTGKACFFTIPGINTDRPTEFFRILRLTWIQNPEASQEFAGHYPFTYETFTPELITSQRGAKERLEKMKEAFSRAHTFLKSSGVDVICVETVSNPMQMFPDGDIGQPNPDDIKFCFTIRLYMSGQIVQMDSDLRASAAQQLIPGQPLKESVEHPGPIFLSRVVQRRYKYRWLAVALMVLTCMTIIVVLSVIYSNT